MNSRKKILIADANDEFRNALSATLDSSDKLTIVADTGDGEQVVRLCKRHKPDLVIMDVVLSSLDGVEVLTSLSQMAPKPRVLVLSPFGSSALAELASALGANYFMAKPCTCKRVLERVEQMLHLTAPAPAAPVTTREMLETLVTDTLHKMGLPANVNGYLYLRSAILMAVDDPSVLKGMTKVLYPKVAEEFESTAARVERSMRHAVEMTWDRGDVRTLQFYFGSSISSLKGKPTNGEFISLLSERIRIQLKSGTVPFYPVPAAAL